MAGSVNKVILIGNLGKDPEVRHTNDGKPVVTLSLATSESWKDRNSGEKKERTEWHRIVIFNENLCRIAEQYLRKGSTIYIEGALQTRKWTDQAGIDKYTTEVVLQKFKGELTMLGGRNDGGGSNSNYSDNDYGNSSGGNFSGGGASGGGASSGGSFGGGASDLDDEIPF